MTEAQLTRRELKKIRDRWPSAFVWKINDRITAGVPDALLVNGAAHDGTVWIEFKRALTMKIDPWTLVTPLQRQTMQRLANNGERVVLAVFWPNKSMTFDYVFRHGAVVPSILSTHTSLASLLVQEFAWPS